MVDFPPVFRQRMEQRWDAAACSVFFEALEANPPVSVRYNVHKMPLPADLVPVPWCANAAYLEARPLFTADPLFHAGAYYVQEASSMFLHTCISQLLPQRKGLKVLDLCAAPGGKSTLLLDMLDDSNLLLANETIRSRVSVLRENLQKWGRSNVLLSNNDVQDFSALQGYFDLIVVDAPCSGEGMFRKDPRARQEWSEDLVQLCAGRQKRILEQAIPLLKEGAILVYSTCTFAREENEEQLQWMLEAGMQSLPVQVPASWGIDELSEPYAYRFYPHRLKGEGLFMACLQKKASSTTERLKTTKAIKKYPLVHERNSSGLSNWLQDAGTFSIIQQGEDWLALPAQHQTTLLELGEVLNLQQVGLKLGRWLKNELLPAHELALSIHKRPELAVAELSLTEAQAFLRKESTMFSAEWPRGWLLATYQGLGLGWMKVLDRRINNYYPSERRVLKDFGSLS